MALTPGSFAFDMYPVVELPHTNEGRGTEAGKQRTRMYEIQEWGMTIFVGLLVGRSGGPGSWGDI